MITYYALVNLNSESVRLHLDEIDLAINTISLREGCPVDSDYTQWITECPEGWQHVDLQLEKAQGYTYLLVFGGDGTHTHVLNQMSKYRNMPLFIGIGCGTMNIGSVATPLYMLHQYENMQIVRRDAICCQTDIPEINYALIDSVVTTTCVGRICDVVSQFSARDILNGIKRQAVPDVVGDDQTRITVYRNGVQIQMPVINKVFTISTAFLSPVLGAHVLAGGADPAACRCFSWGLILSDFPLVWADAGRTDLQREPITSVFYPLDELDVVQVHGLNANAYLVNDGNAICKVNAVRWHYEKNCFEVIKFLEETLCE